jgi:hypothetical protein
VLDLVGFRAGAISTIARENRTNRALDLGLEDFIDFQLSSLPPLPEDFETIKRRNFSQALGATSDSKEVTGE